MFETIIAAANDALYSWLLIILLVAGGLYFTGRTKFVQFRLFSEQLRAVMEKPDGNGVSSFQALMVSTASRVGTGNIIGVSTALCLGGMTLINMPVIFLMSKYAVACLDDYTRQRQQGFEPKFRAKNIGLPHQVDYWQ